MSGSNNIQAGAALAGFAVTATGVGATAATQRIPKAKEEAMGTGGPGHTQGQLESAARTERSSTEPYIKLTANLDSLRKRQSLRTIRQMPVDKPSNNSIAPLVTQRSSRSNKLNVFKTTRRGELLALSTRRLTLLSERSPARR